jgi:hypothetical protein
MKARETVRMSGGPLAGMYGTIVCSSRRRVVLAVAVGSREVQIEIGRDWIVAATRRRQSISRIENPKPSQRRSG